MKTRRRNYHRLMGKVDVNAAQGVLSPFPKSLPPMVGVMTSIGNK
jgi:hypothetical protein